KGELALDVDEGIGALDEVELATPWASVAEEQVDSFFGGGRGIPVCDVVAGDGHGNIIDAITVVVARQRKDGSGVLLEKGSSQDGGRQFQGGGVCGNGNRAAARATELYAGKCDGG